MTFQIDNFHIQARKSGEEERKSRREGERGGEMEGKREREKKWKRG